MVIQQQQLSHQTPFCSPWTLAAPVSHHKGESAQPSIRVGWHKNESPASFVTLMMGKGNTPAYVPHISRRITRCKFLQPLRYLCLFMYLTTVKLVIRNSFYLNHLRKMCGTWAPVLGSERICRRSPVRAQDGGSSGQFYGEEPLQPTPTRPPTGEHLPILWALLPEADRRDLFTKARDRTLFLLDQLPQIAADPQPTLTLAHIVCPHPPFIFGADGEDTSHRDDLYYLGDGNKFQQYRGFSPRNPRPFKGSGGAPEFGLQPVLSHVDK